MPCVGLERMIPAFEQAKTFHALDRVAAVIGHFYIAVATKYIVLVWTDYSFQQRIDDFHGPPGNSVCRLNPRFKR
jgi:hypothetical protein